MYELPDLTNSNIERLEVRFYLVNEDLVATPGFDINWGDVEDSDVDADEVEFARFNGGHIIKVFLESYPEEQSLSHTIVILRPPEFPSLRLEEGREVSEAELWNRLSFFRSDFRRNVHSAAEFSIPATMLPSQGFVREAMAVQTIAGGEKLVLKGAQWAIKGYPDDDISWSMSHYDNCLHGSINRLTFQTPDNPELIVNELLVATNRLNRIILEK